MVSQKLNEENVLRSIISYVKYCWLPKSDGVWKQTNGFSNMKTIAALEESITGEMTARKSLIQAVEERMGGKLQSMPIISVK